MSNNSDPYMFFTGMFLGIVLMGCLIRWAPSSELNIAATKVKEVKDIIVECEKELPRNKKCKLVAIQE